MANNGAGVFDRVGFSHPPLFDRAKAAGRAFNLRISNETSKV
jgi:hypothetical protein